MNSILLVEDDVNLGTTLSEYLQSQGFQVYWATDLKSADAILSESIDLIILDWNLPDGTGIDWLKRPRRNPAPVIMLTARAELTDKVLGLEFGANDYLTKPFEPRELLARIRVQLRQTNAGAVEVKAFQISGIDLNVETHEVSFQGELRELTKIEFKLLKLMMENPRKVFSRETLLTLVWEQRSVSTRTIDVHIGQLRQKFRPGLFESLHGVGYRFVPDNGEMP